MYLELKSSGSNNKREFHRNLIEIDKANKEGMSKGNFQFEIQQKEYFSHHYIFCISNDITEREVQLLWRRGDIRSEAGVWDGY